MQIVEWLIVGAITLSKLTAIILFIVMIVNPARFSKKQKVAICVFAFLAFLPIRPRTLFR